MGRFFAELRRRKIWWVAGVYLAASWVIVQVVSTLEGTLSLPPWMDTATVVFLIAGLPVAIILAWAQETQASRETETSDAAPLPMVTDRPSIAVPPFNSLSGHEEHETVAVLPFVNRTGDPVFDICTESLAEDLISEMSGLTGWKVAARNLSFSYGGLSVDVRKVGRSLDVEYIVEGTLQKSGDSLDLVFQVIETEFGSSLSSERLSLEPEEILGNRAQILNRLLGPLVASIQGHKWNLVKSVPKEQLGGYGLAIKAVMTADRLNGESLRKMLVLLEEAVALDPDDASVLLMQAEQCAYIYALHLHRDPDTVRLTGMSAMRRALQLEHTHNVRLHAANIMPQLGEFEQGLLFARQVYKDKPSLTSKRVLMTTLYHAGLGDELLAAVDEILEVIPTVSGPGLGSGGSLAASFAGSLLGTGNLWDSRGLNSLQVSGYSLIGDYESALEASRLTMADPAQNWIAWMVYANTLAALNRFDEAWQAVTQIRAQLPRFEFDQAINDYYLTFAENAADAFTRGLRKLRERELENSKGI